MVDADGNVFPLPHVLKAIGVQGCNVLRWLAYEFLPMSARNTWSSRLVDFCRLLAFATIVSLTIFETRTFALRDLHAEWPVWILDMVLAILIGNIVKECAIWVSARIANSLGVNFRRRGVMLNGKRFSELFRADGTWRRCELGHGETICEWTDRYGACSRSVTPRPRLPSRSAQAHSKH